MCVSVELVTKLLLGKNTLNPPSSFKNERPSMNVIGSNHDTYVHFINYTNNINTFSKSLNEHPVELSELVFRQNRATYKNLGRHGIPITELKDLLGSSDVNSDWYVIGFGITPSTRNCECIQTWTYSYTQIGNLAKRWWWTIDCAIIGIKPS